MLFLSLLLSLRSLVESKIQIPFILSASFSFLDILSKGQCGVGGVVPKLAGWWLLPALPVSPLGGDFDCFQSWIPNFPDLQGYHRTEQDKAELLTL